MIHGSFVQGCVLTPGGWVRGGIKFSERIEQVAGNRVDEPVKGEDIILPGFIDLHVHGGAGADIMDGGDAIHTVAKLHARHGTTSFLATTVTAETADLVRALTGVSSAVNRRSIAGARVLGVHLEGPFINSGRLGAQPSFTRVADLEEVIALHELAPIRAMTLAPEVVGHLSFIRQLNELGIVTQCGHSAGTYEEGVSALMAGMRGFTHLFNAMSPFHHRHPGMVGAALAHAQFAEVIPDLLHVHPGAIRTAFRSIPRTYCVTDATSACGMPDGEYRLGTQMVTKCMGGVRLADGTLAGSTLTMDQALRNLVEIGLELHDASQRLSTNAADYIGEPDRGRLEPGRWADITVMTADLQLKSVFVEGEHIEIAND